MVAAEPRCRRLRGALRRSACSPRFRRPSQAACCTADGCTADGYTAKVTPRRLHSGRLHREGCAAYGYTSERVSRNVYHGPLRNAADRLAAIGSGRRNGVCGWSGSLRRRKLRKRKP